MPKPAKMRPMMLGITPRDSGGFGWSVSFTNDPRLPRMGWEETFEKALTEARRAIRKVNDNGPIPTVDRRPAAPA